MNNEIFVALCDRLEKEAPSLRWIDEDLGQLNVGNSTRPAVDFPCCLIDIHYSDCRDLTETEQLVKLNITLKLAFPYQGESYSKVPEEVKKRALERYSIVSEVHDCLKGWTAEEMFSPLSRRSGRPSVIAGGIKTYTLVYETTFEEYQ